MLRAPAPNKSEWSVSCIVVLKIWFKGFKPLYQSLSHFTSVTDDPVYDTIKWSESLDDVFIQNYYSDPALSFQYFGSSLGVMRSYPGKILYCFYVVTYFKDIIWQTAEWYFCSKAVLDLKYILQKQRINLQSLGWFIVVFWYQLLTVVCVGIAMKWKQEIDLFDCRNRFWYIEAASCSKDIVILMDNSGSMTGYRNTIARLTVSNILDTLNNNDFVNVYNYSDRADEAVPCFKDKLIQVRQCFSDWWLTFFMNNIIASDITRFRVVLNVVPVLHLLIFLI